MPKRPPLPTWKEFEEAVARFIRALAPGAAVSSNQRLPDRHTGRRRQRDVWVEMVVAGLFPVKLLVSCKRLKRKLSSKDIDAFFGELDSSGAHKGVLYSYSGFTRPAVESARARGICCCRLYASEPSEIPEALLFESFCCSPRIRLAIDRVPDPAFGVATWKDLFDISINTAEGSRPFLDEVERTVHKMEREAVLQLADGFPSEWTSETRISADDPNVQPFSVAVHGSWRFHTAKLEAQLLNGSYSFTTGRFAGRQATPVVDLKGSEPGPGWEPIEGRPPRARRGLVLCVRLGADVRTPLLEVLGPQPISK